MSAHIPERASYVAGSNLRMLLADLRLYRRLIVMRIRGQAQYRVSLALDFLTCLALVTLEFVAVLLYFGRFPTLLGWNVGDVTLLAATVAIGNGLADTVGAGIDHFVDVIRRGEFDQVLLRPAGTFIQIFGNDFLLRKLGLNPTPPFRSTALDRMKSAAVTPVVWAGNLSKGRRPWS